MTLNHIVATLHLLTLGIGYGFAWMRGRALAKTKTVADLDTVFFADNMYGIAAMLWMGTGLWRAFGGLEKGTDYYLESTAFWVKMTLFGILFAFEILPMVTLIKWRMHLKNGKEIDLGKAPLLSKLTYAEVILLTAMVFTAVMMARGEWT